MNWMPLLVIAGELMLWGWGLAVLVMMLGMLFLLISKPWTSKLDIPDVDTKQMDEQIKTEFLQHCYRTACADLVYKATDEKDKDSPTPTFTHLDDKTGKVLYPMEWQLTLWHKLFAWFLFPNQPTLLAQVIGIVLVTPFTNITALSLYYQLYLNEIFHTCFFSRFLHFLMMPLITWVYLLFGAWFELNDVLAFLHLPSTTLPEIWRAYLITHLGDNYLVDLFAINGGFAVFVSFVIWYFLWGLTSKHFALGFCMAPLVGVLWVVANGFSQLTKFSEGGTWYWHSPWWANWIILGCIFAFIQAFSHLPEPLPPRVNRTAHWMSLAHFFRKNKGNPLKALWIVTWQMIWGTFDEFWAGPRLLPLLVLKVLFMLGYSKKSWRTIYKVSTIARKLGDPALDYIGTGGGNQPSPQKKSQTCKDFIPPETFHAAKREKYSLSRKLKLKDRKNPPKKGDVDYDDYLRYKALRTVILRTKANRYAYGPFTNDSKDRQVHQAQLAKADSNIFLDLVREDFYNVEAKRQQALWTYQHDKKKAQ